MLSSLVWVSGSFAKAVPVKEETPLDTDQRELLEELELQTESINQDNHDDSKEAGDVDEELKDLHLENYDDEEEADPFAGTLKGLVLSPVDDTDEAVVGDEEDELSDLEDITIQASDALIITAHSEEDVSHLDICVYETEHDNLYVHHDILLGSFPLAIEWLNYRPSLASNNNNNNNTTSSTNNSSDVGSFIAVGTFEPGIEIWDMDVMDPVMPVLTLGGYKKQQQQSDTSSSKNSKKKKKKGGLLGKSNGLADGSHSAAVMALSWNAHARHVLCSGSADETVKIWDLQTGQCIHTANHHKNKVQSVLWHPVEASVLLTGGFDQRVSLCDARFPEKVQSLFTPSRSDVEQLQWIPHQPNMFLVSTEDGIVSCHDIRMMSASSTDSQHVWMLQAHHQAVTTLSYCHALPGLLATASTDKTWKLWDIGTGASAPQPSCIHSAQTTSKVFCGKFYQTSMVSPGSPAPAGAGLLLALGCEGGSDKIGGGGPQDRLTIINTANLASVRTRWEQHKQQHQQ